MAPHDLIPERQRLHRGGSTLADVVAAIRDAGASRSTTAHAAALALAAAPLRNTFRAAGEVVIYEPSVDYLMVDYHLDRSVVRAITRGSRFGLALFTWGQPGATVLVEDVDLEAAVAAYRTAATGALLVPDADGAGSCSARPVDPNADPEKSEIPST